MTRKKATREFRIIWRMVGHLRSQWIAYPGIMANLIGFASI